MRLTAHLFLCHPAYCHAVAVNLVRNDNSSTFSSRSIQDSATPSSSNSSGTRISNSLRFAAAYVVVGILAINQLTGSILPGGRSRDAAKVFLAVAVLVLVGLMGIVWLGSKGYPETLSRLLGAEKDIADTSRGKEEEEEELTQLLQPAGKAAMQAAFGEEAGQGAAASGSSQARLPLHDKTYTYRPNGNPVQEMVVGAAAANGFSEGGSGLHSPVSGSLTGYMKNSSSGGSGGGSGMATLAECYQSAEFWLLFVIFAVGVGSGLAFSNNLPELVAALSPAAAGGDGSSGSGETAAAAGAVVLVSLFSVGSCFGR